MKKQKQIFLALFLNCSLLALSQVGIGTKNLNSASILDLTSTTKGLLTPRMTTVQRDAIASPATGLLIYNLDEATFNTFNGTVWKDFTTGYQSITQLDNSITTSTTDEVSSGMILYPPAGTYRVNFNSQFKNNPTTTTTPVVPATVTSILADLSLLIKDLDNYYVSGTTEYNSIEHTHYASYDVNNVGVGNPISNTDVNFDLPTTLTIYPGAYYNGAAITFQFNSTITLDGLGDSNAKFIIKANAAINTSIGATFILTNGAQACNVFFLANGGISIGAAATGSTTNILVVGNWVSRAGAVAVGIGTDLDGRILTSAGALTMGDGTLKVATGTSFVNLRSLVSFLAFTSEGAINITGAPATTDTYLTGDLFTNTDAEYVGFGIIPAYTRDPTTILPITTSNPVTLDGRLYNSNFGPPAPGSGTTVITENTMISIATFGIYQNGILVPNSTQTLTGSSAKSDVQLVGIATVAAGQPIEIRWKKTDADLLMNNRTLTLVKVR